MTFIEITFFSYGLKIRKRERDRENQNNLGDWKNCEKTVKPYFWGLLAILVNPGKAGPRARGPSVPRSMGGQLAS